MQNNFYFLSHLSPRLNSILKGKVLSECFCQNKDELIVVFGDQSNDQFKFVIKASLSPSFTCLVFPEHFSRANSNSTDIFEKIKGLKTVQIRQHLNERAFTIELSNNYNLTFKLFGNKSNIILFQKEVVVDTFQSNIKSDNYLNVNQLDRIIDFSFGQFERNDFNLEKTIPTLGRKLIGQFQNLYSQQFNVESFDDLKFWDFLMLQILHLNESIFYLINCDGLPQLSLIPSDDIIERFNDPIKAINTFYYRFSKIDGIAKEKNLATNQIESRIHKLSATINETKKRLKGFEERPTNEQIANILMANIGSIPEHSKSVELYNFYRDEPIIISIKKEFTLQKNAESYYRKSKNEKIEVDNLIVKIKDTDHKLKELEQIRTEIDHITDIKELRKYLSKVGLVKSKEVIANEVPFKIIEIDGWQIWIGKNAINNDLLTQKFAKKDDLWLHARDVSGSHVIIRNQSGKVFPKNVIERAAELAAFYSKRSTDTVCSVTVTPKKYVRKPKNLPAGKVIVEKEETILVTPKGP